MPSPPPAPDSPASIPGDFPVRPLLGWFARHQRELPFRPTAKRKANPYHVLVSEAMAQQTQIATVVPYFERFVAAFPTVADLAAADEQRVLQLWQGLGYYRRARNLRKAAQMVVERFDGRVPDSAQALLELPGVGRYTAGAIASVAFNRPAPIVDGNVARVLARYFHLTEPVDQPATQRRLWDLAGRLVQASIETDDGPQGFNPALMELGALICTPRSPQCLVCPLRDGCAAQAAGVAESLPVKTPKRKPKAVQHTILAIRRGDRYLFEQRPAEGLWSNLWQLPTIEDEPSPQLQDFAMQRFGLTIGSPQHVLSFDHATTHRAIRFELHTAEVTAGRLKPRTGVWRRLDRVEDLPRAKPQFAACERLRGLD